MGCDGCLTDENGVPKGCGSRGNCTSGSCNKLNTFDWLSSLQINDPEEFPIVEISFKRGATKGFYKKDVHMDVNTGDMVVVEAANGYDIGRIGLSGDLVRLQMKKKKVTENRVLYSILRKANIRDLEKMEFARQREQETLVRARAITRTLDMDMKIGDVQFQGDNRKATFYYTANGRIDFRELVRYLAKEFRVKIEMRQIGSRQESARIGGLGPCGRELCCSTWLSDFRSVSTTAARYQNLSINQTKLTGQCGRLKCCLNYELDNYIEALKDFPEKADKLYTQSGTAYLVKTDIFKGLMFYQMESATGRGPILGISNTRAAEVKKMNDNNEKPLVLLEVIIRTAQEQRDDEAHEFADVTGQIVLPSVKKKSSKSRRKRKNRSNRKGGHNKAQSSKNAKKKNTKSRNQKNDKKK